MQSKKMLFAMNQSRTNMSQPQLVYFDCIII